MYEVCLKIGVLHTAGLASKVKKIRKTQNIPTGIRTLCLSIQSDILPMTQLVRRVSRDGEETTAIESTSQGFS
jgi:hypothetical protein